MADPTPPSSPSNRLTLIALVAALGVAGAFIALVSRTPSGGTTTTTTGPGEEPGVGEAIGTVDQPTSTKPYDTKQVLELHDDAPRPVAVVVDLLTPAALKTALLENAWLERAGRAPLGQGFLGGWAAFFGSQQGDVGLGGSGLVRDALLDALTSAVGDRPLRAVMFSRQDGQRELSPALVVEGPSAGLSTSLAALTAALQRGGYSAPSCPGEPADTADAGVVETAGVDGGPSSAKPVPTRTQIDAVRWVVAEHPLYVATSHGRVAFGRQPSAVIHAVCTPLPAVDKPAGVDLQVTLVPSAVGRETQVLAELLGVQAPKAQWKVDGTRLVPVGFSGDVPHEDRLGSGAPAEDMKKAIPEDTPVVLFASLALPEKLDTASLSAHWQGKGGGATKARNVAALWRPRGELDVPTEVGVLWSDVNDEADLRAIFTGKNHVVVDKVCGQLALASTEALLASMKAACKGTTPSLLFAPPAIAQGLSQPLSIGLVVDPGRALAQLLRDGFASEQGPQKAEKGKDKDKDAKKALPQEIDDAEKLLRELPRFGLVGNKGGGKLAPRGFST